MSTKNITGGGTSYTIISDYATILRYAFFTKINSSTQLGMFDKRKKYGPSICFLTYKMLLGCCGYCAYRK